MPRPDLAAYGLTALCVLCACVLIGLGHPVPDFLPFIALTALGAGGGLSLNSPGTKLGTETLTRSSGPAPAPAARPTAPAPRPAPAPGIPA